MQPLQLEKALTNHQDVAPNVEDPMCSMVQLPEILEELLQKEYITAESEGFFNNATRDISKGVHPTKVQASILRYCMELLDYVKDDGDIANLVALKGNRQGLGEAVSSLVRRAVTCLRDVDGKGLRSGSRYNVRTAMGRAEGRCRRDGD